MISRFPRRHIEACGVRTVLHPAICVASYRRHIEACGVRTVLHPAICVASYRRHFEACGVRTAHSAPHTRYLRCVISTSYQVSINPVTARQGDRQSTTGTIRVKSHRSAERGLQIWIVVAHEKESSKIAPFDSGLWTLNRDKHPLQEHLEIVRRYDYVRAGMSSSLVIGTVESGEVTMTTTQTAADSAGVKQSATAQS